MIDFQHGDAVQWAKDYKGEKFHALLCDPPYHLTSITKRFGKEGSAPAQYGTDGVFARSSRGFMNSVWDGGDVAFRPETWAAFANVLHDGAFGFAFASSRGWHRLAVAIEDAGFVIHPSMFGWAFGSGFPKATRVDTQIDKAAGAEGERGEITSITGDRANRVERHGYKENGGKSSVFTNAETVNREYLPATPLAQAFAGHRYGLQALKPALEPIIVFQKPYAGRPIDCITATGAGTLNVDGGRIPANDKAEFPAGVVSNTESIFGGGNGRYHDKARTADSDPQGRWPANFYVDAEAARRLDAQSGERPVGNFPAVQNTTSWKMSSRGKALAPAHKMNDSGGASRFFYNVAEAIDDADPVRYVAKSSRRERDAGLDGFELKEATKMDGGAYHRTGGVPGVGPDRTKVEMRNNHPCIKPLNLTKYLATLLLPPIEYAPRRLFCPFSGSGSEAIGGHQAGWEFVQGVEITEEYLPIAQARAEYWMSRDKQLELELT